MAPSTAMEIPCPVKRMVDRNPAARLSCDRSTEPMTADMLGELKPDMPTPMVPRASSTRHTDDEANASCTIPAAISTIPAVAGTRDPTLLSDSRPETGESAAISTG
ncbi:MAG: hypothetical protein A2133_10090 [Actinobacteria bacterium RBG_16_64_13]|nr:MAG: hypothetical protein A2133_10090 [Actinobacteria bacterium RBG_16_64_13]